MSGLNRKFAQIDHGVFLSKPALSAGQQQDALVPATNWGG